MRYVRLMPFLIVVLTFLLILLGGIVHNTESSLACPDWPLCYGQFFPEMRGGILIEHSHRLLASLVGFVVVLSFALSLPKKSPLNPCSRKLLLALILVIVQGIFGGITVIYKLPTIVSTTHLALAMSFFLYVLYIFHLQAVGQTAKVAHSSETLIILMKVKRLLYLFLGLVFFQVVYGAFIRHSGIGAACGIGIENSFLCFDVASNSYQLVPDSLLGATHFFHRVLGFALALISLSFLVIYFQLRKVSSPVSELIGNLGQSLLLIPFICIIQALLGILTVATVIGPITTTLHLAGATLLLAYSWRGLLWTKDLLDQAEQSLIVPSFLENLIELAKPKLSLLVVATTLIGMFATSRQIDFFQTAYVIIAMCLLVMGAAILNCYMEKDSDSKMERTRNRASVTGAISSKLAITIGIVLESISLYMLYNVNLLTMFLGALGAILYLLAYTPLKEKTELAVYVGAIPGAIPILMGWTAVGEPLSVLAFSLFLILFIWQIPHFFAIAIIYSKQYKAAGLTVFPNTLGVKPTIKLSILNSIFLLLVSLFPFFLGGSSLLYAFAAGFLGLVFIALTTISHNFENQDVLILKSKYVFWYSLIFLPLILIFMIFLK
jgi:protoheme IX farnesyltransferase